MLVREHTAEDIASIHRFLNEHGWAHRIGSVEQFASLLRNSQRTAMAVEGSTIVGFARGITDGISNGYLSMVAVSPACRRQGIGSALVQHIVGDAPGITWVLRAGRDGAPEFFAKLGFVNSSVAMERRRA
ncbi:MAG: GNAT family N-acetyltransferase [Pseudomonadota bacterium]